MPTGWVSTSMWRQSRVPHGPPRNEHLLEDRNTGAGSINNAVHQKVCVDTWDRNGCKPGEACFSFGKTGWSSLWGPSTWLAGMHTLGGLLMKGEIYEDLTVKRCQNTKDHGYPR
jgi:hypothetical protein